MSTCSAPGASLIIPKLGGLTFCTISEAEPRKGSATGVPVTSRMCDTCHVKEICGRNHDFTVASNAPSVKLCTCVHTCGRRRPWEGRGGAHTYLVRLFKASECMHMYVHEVVMTIKSKIKIF